MRYDSSLQAKVDRALEHRDQLQRYADKPTKQLGEPAPLHPVFVDILNSLGMPQRQPEEQT
jgi:hypothetical protein